MRIIIVTLVTSQKLTKKNTDAWRFAHLDLPEKERERERERERQRDVVNDKATLHSNGCKCQPNSDNNGHETDTKTATCRRAFVCCMT
jgi:hypothetical protein